MAENDSAPRGPWSTRAAQPGDAASIREVLLAAFPTAEEADLVEALREDPAAWIDGLSTALGITAPFDVPDDAFLALPLDPGAPTPRGEIVYPPAFGV